MSAVRDVPDELVTRAMSGEHTAVGQVLAIIRPLVVRYCRARLGRMDRSAVSADDVAQEVCLAVLTALPGYRVQGRPFLAFVYGIASHKVIDAHRAATRDRAESVAYVPDSIETADGPEQRALRIELAGEMAQLIDQLPEKQREILLLRVVVGLSAEETAEAVGSTPGAVRVAQHRALSRLRKAMPDESFARAVGDDWTDSGGVAVLDTDAAVRSSPSPRVVGFRARPTAPASLPHEDTASTTAARTDELIAEAVEQLHTSHASYVRALATVLDTDAGLATLEDRHDHDAFVAGLASNLNLDAGLASLLRGDDPTTPHELPQ